MSFALRAPPVPRRTVTWKQLVFGGGGFITHLSASSDGTLVAGTDVGGAYVYDTGTSKWVQIITQQRVKTFRFKGYRVQNGVADIAIAHSDSNRVYFFHRENAEARLYRSNDKGASSFPTNYPVNTDASLDGNDQSSSGIGGVRLYHGKLEVDPQNPDVVYASNPGGYPLRTLDGGVTWESITSLPLGSSNNIGAINFTFDEASGLTGGKTNTIYVQIVGTGVYQSTNAGTSFSQISSTIVTPSSNAVVNNGKFYIAHVIGSTRYVSRYAAGSWTDVRSNTSNRYALASHADAGKIVAMRSGDLQYDITTDGGDTWTSRTKATQTFTSDDSPWQAAKINAGFGPTLSHAHFTGDVLYATMGQGLFKATISGTTAPSWTSQVAGIEELVINQIVNIPGANKIIIAGWDEGAWIRSNSTLDTAPADTAQVAGGISLVYCFQAAVDPQNANYIAYVGNTAAMCGYSTDGGATFNAFAATPGAAHLLNYASVAVNNGVIIWTNSGSTNQRPFRSTDNGATWTQLTIADIPASGDTGWQTSISRPKRWVEADRVNANIFYMSNYLHNQTPDIRAVWKSTDAGASFTKATQPYVSTAYQINEMKAVPGNEGHLFVTGGHVTASAHPDNQLFYKSTDGGSTWASVSADIKEVSFFGFGKARTGGNGYPTIFFAGFYKSQYGVYKVSDGDFTKIVQLANSDHDAFPLHINDAITAVEGDMDVEGRVYVGFEGNGCVYADAA